MVVGLVHGWGRIMVENRVDRRKFGGKRGSILAVATHTKILVPLSYYMILA